MHRGRGPGRGRPGVRVNIGSSGIRVSSSRSRHVSYGRHRGPHRPLTRRGSMISGIGVLAFLACFIALALGVNSTFIFVIIIASFIAIGVGSSFRQPLQQQPQDNIQNTQMNTQSSSNTIVCSYCQTQNSSNTTTCSSCGANI